MHQGTEKSKIAKITNTREGLTAMRADIMKADAINKSINVSVYQQTYKVPSNIVALLIKAGAVEDKAPNAPRNEGKLLSWVYKKTDNGVVDAWLVEKVIELEKVASKTYREHKKEQKTPEAATVLQGLKPLPKKGDGMDIVSKWLQDEVNKNAQVKGYIRPEAEKMYIRIIEMIEGLNELKECIQRVNL